MDQNCNTFRANLLGPITEHEQHRVDDVTFTAAVGSNDRSEAFVERPENLFPSVAFEINVINMSDDQSWPLETSGAGRRGRRRNINIADSDPAFLNVFRFLLLKIND